MGRSKKAGKSVESIKERIEKHFERLEKEIEEKNEVLARYHVKEIDKSLIDALEKKMRIFGKLDEELLRKYRERLEELEDRIDIE